MALAVIPLVGLANDRPPASAVNAGQTFTATDTGATSRATASGWVGGSAAQSSTGPVYLTAEAETTLTHPEVTNAQIAYSAFRAVSNDGLSKLQADFDVADAADFTYDPAHVQFVAGEVGLKGTAGSETVMVFTNRAVDSSYQAHATGGGQTVVVTSERPSLGGSYDLGRVFLNTSDLSTSYATDGYGPGWIQFDLGALAYLTKIRIINSGPNGYGCSATTVSVSTNGTSWSVIGTSPGSAGGEVVADTELPVNGNVRYVKYALAAVQYSTLCFYRFLPYYAATTYETGIWPTVVTKDSSRFPFTVPTTTLQVNSMTFDVTTPANTAVRVLISFDGRVTWKRRTGGIWVTHTDMDPTTWNTPAEVSSGFPYTPLPADVGLDVAASFNTTSAPSTPVISGFTIGYNELVRFDLATFGKPGASGVELELTLTSPTTTTVKNKTGTLNQFIVNALVG